MPFSINDIVFGCVAPVVVAGILLLVLRRLLPTDLGERYASSIAGVLGFCTGYGLLALAPWSPTAHWHWLPYATLAAALVGPIACAEGVRFFERLLLYLLVAVPAGWFLVPAWDDLSPSRASILAVFVTYAVVLASSLEPLAKRFAGPLLPLALWGSLTATAVVLALSGSLRFAQMALAGAGAVFGVTLAVGFQRDEYPVTGMAFMFSVLAVGSMLIGRVHSFSDVPLASYVLVPAAPVTLWLCNAGPLSRMTGFKRCFVLAVLPLVPLGVAVLLAVFKGMKDGGTY